MHPQPRKYHREASNRTRVVVMHPQPRKYYREASNRTKGVVMHPKPRKYYRHFMIIYLTQDSS